MDLFTLYGAGKITTSDYNTESVSIAKILQDLQKNSAEAVKMLTLEEDLKKLDYVFILATFLLFYSI
jgi:hypothetical protein